MEIKLQKRGDIDDKLWNGCVHFALGAPPYAYTWYLDNVCEDWMGLVVGNYKMVMPIVLGKKFGIQYTFQPFFTQQLGVYADIPLSKDTIDAFMDAIPKEVKYIEMSLNESNYAPSKGVISERTNFLLDLKPDYELLKSNYSGNVLRKIRKAEKAGVVIDNQLKPEEFVDFYKEHTAPKIEGFSDMHYYAMLRLVYKAMHYNMGFIIGVRGTENQLLAVNFILNHPQRMINLMPSSSTEGNDLGAMAFLINHLIASNAGQYKYFDFEGSMIDGVANFYGGFGAKKANYYHVKMNHLPRILRIFKK